MWENLLSEFILGLMGILLSCLGVFVTYLINKHVKNLDAKNYMMQLNELVQKAVLETYQTYVEELKDKNMFDEYAHNMALNKALDIIKTNLPTDLETWLKQQFPAFESYLITLIEANVGLLKRGD